MTVDAAARSPAPSELPVVVRWGLAVVLVLLAHAGNRLIENGLFPAPLFVAAVMAVTHFGGTGPALLAFLLAGALLNYYSIPPPQLLHPA